MTCWVCDRVMAVLRWLDVGLSLPWGDGRHTVSWYFAKSRDAGQWWGRAGCRVLDWFVPGHCDYAETPDD